MNNLPAAAVTQGGFAQAQAETSPASASSDIRVAAASRVFIYRGQHLPDPNPAFSLEQVKQVFAGVWPELTTATIGEPVAKGGQVHYEFFANIGVKGASEGVGLCTAMLPAMSPAKLPAIWPAIWLEIAPECLIAAALVKDGLAEDGRPGSVPPDALPCLL